MCGCRIRLRPRSARFILISRFWKKWYAQSTYKIEYYKNPSQVWGWDRKIRPEDHPLASEDLPSDDKRWSRGTDFYIASTHESWILFLAHYLILHFMFEEESQKFLNMLWYDMLWWRQFIITTSRLMTMRMSSNTTKVLPSRDTLGKIAWVR